MSKFFALPNRDQIFASIISKAIVFNEKRIRSKIKKFSGKETEVLFSEMTEEIIQIFQEHKSILKYIFDELEGLPKTKKVLLEENLIIQCLKEDLIRRKALRVTTADQQITKAVHEFVSILIAQVLQKFKKHDLVKSALLNSLKNNLALQES